MEIPKLKIRFIDSVNFFQIPLKAFPKTFGMKELKKGVFPHYFNKECDEHYVAKFLKWYNDRVSENYIFHFQREIIKCCRSDVDILRRGSLEKTLSVCKTSILSVTSQ